MSDELTNEDRELMKSIGVAFRPYRLPASRSSRRSMRPWFAAIAIVVVVGVVGIVWRPPSTLATWTSAPTSSNREELPDATVRACRQQAARLIAVGADAGWPEDPTLGDMRSVPLVAHDQRGAASAALFADEERGSVWICAIIPVAGQPSYVELSGGTGAVPEDFGDIEVWTASSGWNWDYGGRWEIAGRIAPDVAEVTIAREDGESVVATLDDGWFLAWWPSESDPVRLDLRDSAGEPLDSIDLGDRYAHEPSCRASLFGICVWGS